MLFAFAAVLRALEPAELSTNFSLLRLVLQGLACFGAGTAIAWACASRALADLGAADRDAAVGLDCAHRTTGRFALGSFAVWIACVGIGSAVEAQVADSAGSVVDRLLAFAALGLIAAAANMLLAARVMALPLAWTLRLLVASLVIAPVILNALVARDARARAGRRWTRR